MHIFELHVAIDTIFMNMNCEQALIYGVLSNVLD